MKMIGPLYSLNHYYNDKVNNTIQSFNTSGTKYNLPPFVVIRKYPTQSYTIPANGSRWVSVNKSNGTHLTNKTYENSELSDLQKYVLSQQNSEYIVGGVIAASVGCSSYGVALKCSITEFTGNGLRLYNLTSKDITTPVTITYSNNNTQAEQYPPYVDLVYIRYDIGSSCI